MSPTQVIRQYLTRACRASNDYDLKFILRDGVSVAHKIIILPVLADMSEVFCNACIDSHEELTIVLPDINKEQFDEARDFLYMFGDGSKIYQILGANKFRRLDQDAKQHSNNAKEHANIYDSEEVIEIIQDNLEPLQEIKSLNEMDLIETYKIWKLTRIS